MNAKEKKHYNEIFESTRAMIFFGTPHRGLLVDDLLRTVGEKSTRERLIESLKSGSEELQRVLDRFIDYIQLQSDTDDRKLMIQSFKETKQTKRLGLEVNFKLGDITL